MAGLHASPARSSRAHARASGALEELDATARHTAHLQARAPYAPAPALASAPAPALASAPRASLEDLLPALVRKIAWSGDERRGTVRIELGAGPLEGATLLVRAERGRVEVTLSTAFAPGDADAQAWCDRIARRLEARGLEVEAVHVR
jgi:hypothetical protein